MSRQQDEPDQQLAILCHHMIYLKDQEWIDYLSHQAIVNGGVIAEDSDGGKILQYPILRSDLPDQPTEYAVISTGSSTSTKRIRWINVHEPAIACTLELLNDINDEKISYNDPDSQTFKVQGINYAGFSLLTKSKKEDLLAYRSYFDKETLEGLDNIFLQIAQISDKRNYQEKVQKMAKFRNLLFGKSVIIPTLALWFLHTTHLYFMIYLLYNPNSTKLIYFGLYLGGIFSTLIEYILFFVVSIALLKCCSSNKSISIDDFYSKARIFAFYFISFFSFLSMIIVCLAVFLVQDDYSKAIAKINLCLAIFSFVFPVILFTSNCCKGFKELKQAEESNMQEQLKKRVFIKRKSIKKVIESEADHEGKVLLIDDDESNTSSIGDQQVN